MKARNRLATRQELPISYRMWTKYKEDVQDALDTARRGQISQECWEDLRSWDRTLANHDEYLNNRSEATVRMERRLLLLELYSRHGDYFATKHKYQSKAAIAEQLAGLSHEDARRVATEIQEQVYQE